MRRVLRIVIGTLALGVMLAGITAPYVAERLAPARYERPDRILAATADSVNAQILDLYPDARPGRWLFEGGMYPAGRPDPSDIQAVIDCLRASGERTVPAEETRIRVWRTGTIVLFRPTRPAVEYFGITVPGPLVRHIVLATGIYGSERQVLFHELSHAVCDDICPHGRTRAADRCALRLAPVAWGPLSDPRRGGD